MRSRERFLAALHLDIPDRVPIFDQLYHRGLYEHVLGYCPVCYNNIDSAKLGVELGLDASLLIYGNYPGIDIPSLRGCWDSEWGVKYSIEGAGWPTGVGQDYANSSFEKLRKFEIPNALTTSRWAEAKTAAEFLHKNNLGAIGALRGPFAMLTWHFIGMETTMMATISEPELIEKACQIYTDYAVGLIEGWRKCEVDAVFITEDLGSSHGPLIAPEQYKHLFLPSLKRIVQQATRCGIKVILHSDGMVLPFVPFFIEAGITALHPIEKKAGMSLRDCKAKWGGSLVVCGNLDTKGALLHGTEEDVRIDVRATLAEGTPYGGYIFSSDHSLGNDLPINNILAMIDEAKNATMF